MSPADGGYNRVLLKLSGQALMGERGRGPTGIDPGVLVRIGREVKAACESGVQMGVVIGGGNIFRGLSDSARDMDRVTADHMGMLATVINSLALGDALKALGLEARVMSALPMEEVAETFTARAARDHLSAGRVVIMAAGTGNPLFTTDTAAVLRAREVGAEAMLKATRVDGVFDADPEKVSGAKKFTRLTYGQVIELGLGVMDLTAVTLARDGNLPLIVFDLFREGSIIEAVSGKSSGTLIVGE